MRLCDVTPHQYHSASLIPQCGSKLTRVFPTLEALWKDSRRIDKQTVCISYPEVPSYLRPRAPWGAAFGQCDPCQASSFIGSMLDGGLIGTGDRSQGMSRNNGAPKISLCRLWSTRGGRRDMELRGVARRARSPQPQQFSSTMGKSDKEAEIKRQRRSSTHLFYITAASLALFRSRFALFRFLGQLWSSTRQ